jgi:hypothetical protein
MNFLQEIAHQDFFSDSHDVSPAQISFLANTNYKTSTFFVFKNQSITPAGVLRISNTRQFVMKEYTILKHIHDHANKSLRLSVPVPIKLHQCGNRYVASQSYIGAAKLKPPSWFEGRKKVTVNNHLNTFRKWLITLWRIPVNDLSEENVRGVDIFEQLNYCLAHCNSNNERFFKQVLSFAESFRRKELPLVINHNDLCLHNIFFNQGTFKVIDWELSYITWPVYDWFYFIANYALRLWAGRNMKIASVVKAARRAFCEPNWFSKLVREQTTDLYLEMNLDVSLIPSSYCLSIFDLLYRRYFPNLIDPGQCAPLFNLDSIYLTQ